MENLSAWICSVRPEWRPRITEVCEELQAYDAEHGCKLRILQMKEKWGALRFYWMCESCTREQWEHINKRVEQLEKECTI